MGNQDNSNESGNNRQGRADTEGTRNPVEERQLGQEQAEQSARTIGQYIRNFLARLSTTDWIVAIGTVVIAAATVWNVVVVTGQLGEMHSSGIDTHNLAEATGHLADRARDQADAMEKLRKAGEAQAGAMDKLRIAGEAQAKSMDRLKSAGEAQAIAAEHLADAGRAQASATRNLADNSAQQLGAIQAGADAAKAQALAVQEQATATVTASKATDRLADAGQAQSKAVLQSLDVARAANDIASRTAIAADRAWVGIQMPVGDIEPVVGQDYKVDINLSNSGRSPAINALAQVEISLFHLSDNIETTLGACPVGTCQKLTVFPSGSGFGGTSLLYHLAIPAQRMVADEIQKLTVSPQVDIIVVRVRVDYADTNGNPHMTSACGYFVSKLGFTSCVTGNSAN